jgi:hypothetical protein
MRSGSDTAPLRRLSLRVSQKAMLRRARIDPTQTTTAIAMHQKKAVIG